MTLANIAFKIMFVSCQSSQGEGEVRNMHGFPLNQAWNTTSAKYSACI